MSDARRVIKEENNVINRNWVNQLLNIQTIALYLYYINAFVTYGNFLNYLLTFSLNFRLGQHTILVPIDSHAKEILFRS